MLIKVQLDATVCRQFIHCHVTLHVSVVTQPSSGVLKTVSATSGVCHGNGTVTSFHRGLMMGAVTPETCRVSWQWINVCILLHRGGPLLTLYHTELPSIMKLEWCFISATEFQFTNNIHLQLHFWTTAHNSSTESCTLTSNTELSESNDSNFLSPYILPFMGLAMTQWSPWIFSIIFW